MTDDEIEAKLTDLEQQCIEADRFEDYRISATDVREMLDVIRRQRSARDKWKRYAHAIRAAALAAEGVDFRESWNLTEDEKAEILADADEE